MRSEMLYNGCSPKMPMCNLDRHRFLFAKSLHFWLAVVGLSSVAGFAGSNSAKERNPVPERLKYLEEPDRDRWQMPERVIDVHRCTQPVRHEGMAPLTSECPLQGCGTIKGMSQGLRALVEFFELNALGRGALEIGNIGDRYSCGNHTSSRLQE
jgi:hypothetical protein